MSQDGMKRRKKVLACGTFVNSDKKAGGQGILHDATANFQKAGDLNLSQSSECDNEENFEEEDLTIKISGSYLILRHTYIV